MGAVDSRIRTAAIAAGAFAVLLSMTQLVFPGDTTGPGTPAAVLFGGLVVGMLNALTAAGLVVVYRSTRVINFAQTALGALGGELTFQLLLIAEVSFWVALPAGLIAAAGAGLVFDLVIARRFFRSPRLVLTVATIAAAGLVAAVARQMVSALPFIPRDRASYEDVAGLSNPAEHLPLADWVFFVGDLRIPFGLPHVLALGGAAAALVGVGLYFRYAKSGIAVRAMAENAERAALLGISVHTLSSIVWLLAGLLSGVGIILTGLISTPAAASGIAPAVLLPALAAAVVARFRSIPVATATAVGLALFSQAFKHSFGDDDVLVDVVVFLLVAGGLLLQRRTLQRSEDGGGVSWDATTEQRPVPRELLAVPGVRAARYALIGLGLLVVALYPWLVSTRAVVLGGVIAVFTIVALSILVLTGWAGQLSLGQFALVAVGDVVGAALTSTVGIPFWFAVPLTAAFTAGFAVLLGIPALRIKGLFLAVTTFAFAIAVRSVLFEERYFGWLLADRVERPTLFLLDFDDERSMYYLCVAALVGAVVLVNNLRRSRTGRVLIAVRENDANLQTFGVSAVRAKLLAFAVAGGLAGFAGAVFVHLQRGLAADSFVAQRSIDVFLMSILGGVTSIAGVLLGSVFFNVQQFFLSGNVVVSAIAPFAVLTLLYVEPGGIIGIVNRIRDSVLRIVAQRRQLVVPSLFADYDPDTVARRLIPLADPIPGAGLGALPVTTRFALASELYAGRGVRFMEQMAPAKQSREAELIAAAASVAVADEAELPDAGAHPAQEAP